MKHDGNFKDTYKDTSNILLDKFNKEQKAYFGNFDHNKYQRK